MISFQKFFASTAFGVPCTLLHLQPLEFLAGIVIQADPRAS